MQCLIGCLALGAPRFAIVLFVIFSDYIGRAYETVFWPFIGFLIMPTTTLAYAWAINSRGSVAGIHLAVVVFAVLIDLGSFGGSGAAAQRKRDAGRDLRRLRGAVGADARRERRARRDRCGIGLLHPSPESSGLGELAAECEIVERVWKARVAPALEPAAPRE